MIELIKVITWYLDQGTLKGGSITVPLTSCLTSFEMCVCAIQNSVHPAQRHISKPVKQEVNCTVIL